MTTDSLKDSIRGTGGKITWWRDLTLSNILGFEAGPRGVRMTPLCPRAKDLQSTPRKIFCARPLTCGFAQLTNRTKGLVFNTPPNSQEISQSAAINWLTLHTIGQSCLPPNLT